MAARPLDDRKALEGIVFVLRTGIPWASLPQQMGCGSGMTCWRRLRDWQAAGVFERLRRALLDRLGRGGRDQRRGRCSLDSAAVPAKKGPTCVGPNPTDRGKPGSKRHVLVDANGIPLAVKLTAANVHDSTTAGAAARRRFAHPPVRRSAAQAPGQAAP